MKIVLTGGGSGGHFYPLIAVAESIRREVAERKTLDPELFYIGPDPFDKQALLEQDITYIGTTAGKVRRYFSLLNIIDVFKTIWGIWRSILQLFHLYPDVIFSTGGYASFPTLFAARILRIPVIIHDSDAHPGRATLFAAPFAKHISIAHPDALNAFPKNLHGKIALIGQPVRHDIEATAPAGGHQFLKFSPDVPTILILGGSLGAQALNNVVLDALPTLVERYNIVHQTGAANLAEVTSLAHVRLQTTRYEERYRAFGLLNALALRMTAGISSLVVARAGSGTIFEIAAWGIPSILVPIPNEVSHDQSRNAFSFARSGGAVVMAQRNLTTHLFIAEIDRIMGDAALRQRMGEAARSFARPDAAAKIAHAIMEMALAHAR